jgi:glucosamine-6-phosphate deaminase
MRICRCTSKEQLALDAALAGAEGIRKALYKKGRASIILATGKSQEAMLSHLVEENLDWSSVTVFHLDEYIGIRATHPASFRKYLQERFVSRAKPKAFHAIQGEKEPISEVKRLNKILSSVDVDVAFVGIGENGHLAFNDPPANLETELPYIVVRLDDACRRQQVGEGWFKSIREVPPSAITMSIQQILKAEQIICSVPDARKAKAVRAAVEGEISPAVPASVLQKHPRAYVYVDPDSASLLGPARDVQILEVASLDDIANVKASSRYFHLFIAADFTKIPEMAQAAFAARALDAGAVTVTSYGKGSSAMELAVDGECVRRGMQTGIAESADEGIVTMSYKVEDWDEGMFMFLDTIQPAAKYEKTCNSAVALLVGRIPHREDVMKALAHPGEFIDAFVDTEDDEG